MKINKGEVKMKSSKIFAIFIVLLFLFSVTVFANESYQINYENEYQFNEDVHKDGSIIENDELYNYLVEQSKAHNEVINILDYQISEANAKAVITKFFLNEEVYYVSSVTADTYENGYLKEIRVEYSLSQEEISSYEQQLDNILKEYLSGINSEWLDIEKIVYTDIFVCKKVELGTSNECISNTIVGALINKSATSEGYAKTFNYLLKKVNINSTIVTSLTSNMAWNMVEVDGTYYHIDCSKNDISGYGKTTYEYMFKSDNYMSEFVNEWVSDYTSTPAEEYDADWLFADTYLEYKDGYWYYLYNNFDTIELDRYNFVTANGDFGAQMNELVPEPLIWTPGFASDGTNFYASTDKDIYIISCDFEAGEASYEKYFSITDDKKVIYSIEYVDGKLYYSTTQIDDKGFTDESTMTLNVYVKLLDLTSDETTVSILKNETYDLKLTKNPIDATETVVWEALDTNIVTVDENGKIQGISKGNTQVTATSGNLKVIYDITVTEDEPEEPETITTLETEIVNQYEIIIFNTRTTINSIINSQNFPVLENSEYSITVLDQDGNLKQNWEEFIGSKNTIIVSKADETKAEFKAIVRGDVTGNGILRMYDAFQILKDVIVGKTFDALDCIIRDHSSSGDRIVRMYDAFQYLKDAILS